MTNSFLEGLSLDQFNITSRHIYENAYKSSGSIISNSCFLHRVCWNVFFDYSFQVLKNGICLIADDNQINQAHIVYPLGSIDDLELLKLINYWKKVFENNNKVLRIEYIDEKNMTVLQRCLTENHFLSGNFESVREQLNYIAYKYLGIEI